jgi:DNA-binding transcriptional MerR regulator
MGSDRPRELTDLDDALIDAYAVSNRLGISPATVRSWVKRGRLTRAGTDPDGRALYRFPDVWRLSVQAAHNKLLRRSGMQQRNYPNGP